MTIYLARKREFPCLIGRIGIRWVAELVKRGIVFPCLIGRIGISPGTPRWRATDRVSMPHR